jgi:hypothetical protein
VTDHVPIFSLRPAPLARVIYSDPGVAVGEVGRYFVALWRGDVTRSRFEKQRWALTEVVQRHPRGVGFLCVIEPTSKPPDAELRRASVDMVEEHGDRIRCVALVIEGRGFAAALTRAGISGMLLLIRKRPAFADFANVPSALGWMGQYVPVEVETDMAGLVEEVRRGMTAAASR